MNWRISISCIIEAFRYISDSSYLFFYLKISVKVLLYSGYWTFFNNFLNIYVSFDGFVPSLSSEPEKLVVYQYMIVLPLVNIAS